MLPLFLEMRTNFDNDVLPLRFDLGAQTLYVMLEENYSSRVSYDRDVFDNPVMSPIDSIVTSAATISLSTPLICMIASLTSALMLYLASLGGVASALQPSFIAIRTNV